jgi:hypothetical protein
MQVCTDGATSTVTVASAGSVDAGGVPRWQPVAQVPLAKPLVVQGLAATRDVLFVATHRDQAPVRGDDLTAPRVLRKSGQPDLTDAALVDLSH